MLGLVLDARQLGGAVLHAVGELIGRGARGDLRIADDPRALAVELRQQIDAAAARLPVHAVRVLHARHQVAARPQLDAA